MYKAAVEINVFRVPMTFKAGFHSMGVGNYPFQLEVQLTPDYLTNL